MSPTFSLTGINPFTVAFIVFAVALVCTLGVPLSIPASLLASTFPATPFAVCLCVKVIPRKGMARLTMFLGRIGRRRAYTILKGVLSRRHHSEVVWITAKCVTANMINEHSVRYRLLCVVFVCKPVGLLTNAFD